MTLTVTGSSFNQSTRTIKIQVPTEELTQEAKESVSIHMTNIDDFLFG